MDLDTLTLKQAVQMISDGKLKSLELTKHHIEKATTIGKELNAFITITEKEALDMHQRQHRNNYAFGLAIQVTRRVM